jgi:hypothetical protein
MKVTIDWLKEKNACKNGVDWCIKNKLIDLDSPDFLRGLAKGNQYQWANWLIVRVMTRPQSLAYAIFAAEQVIDIYEKLYPDNKKPREAIEAAKKVLENDTPKNRKAAAAADAACAAYAADYATDYATYAAADYAADAAAYAAACAADYAAADYAAADDAAADAADDAADAYACADYAIDYATYAAARKEMQERILAYGLKLLENIEEE